ncbi:unnamed protein product [Auanema sp. JU1783]|nr:unnamed protein product [Auanema sp. JU1783]
MACGLALKRPHEYDSYMSEDGYSSEAKRARQTAHCSPFRAQIGTIAASLPSTSSNFAQKIQNQESNNPFSSITGCQLTSSQLGAYLRSEIKNLKRRKLIPRKTVTDDITDENKPNKEYRAPESPSHSGSDSDGETSTSKQSNNILVTLADKPQFSLKQVQLICERLLKEQEMRLRQEYESALCQKLDEQHQQYVNFATEQLAAHHKEKTREELSYLS